MVQSALASNELGTNGQNHWKAMKGSGLYKPFHTNVAHIVICEKQ